MSAAPQLFQTDPWGLFSLKGLQEDGFVEFSKRLLDKVAVHFGAKGATLFIRSHQSNKFVLAAKSGSLQKVPDNAWVMEGLGIAGRVIQLKRPLVLNDLASEPGFQDLAGDESKHIGSSMIVPLLDPNGEITGVLNVSRDEGEPFFNANDLQTAIGIASVVALAVSNATLFQDLMESVTSANESRERLRAVFESVASAVIVFDALGNVVDCNEVGRTKVGDSAHTWIGSRSVAKSLPRLISEAQVNRRRVVERIQDESGDSWLLTVSPLRTGGSVLTVIDLTEAEKAVRQAERLQRLAEIGQMTAALAHEIRNPLTGIRAGAQMAQVDPESASEYLDVIMEEAVRLNNLCDEFLDYAKPQDYSLQPSLLLDVVERVVKIQQPEYEKARVALDVVVTCGPVSVLADRPRIEQVVHNLLRNAREACKSGGRVSVELCENGLTIKDDGDGMSQNQLENLFKPFFTTKSDGLGLGLCNVKKILDGHKATITVSSVFGRGSEFAIEFNRSEG